MKNSSRRRRREKKEDAMGRRQNKLYLDLRVSVITTISPYFPLFPSRPRSCLGLGWMLEPNRAEVEIGSVAGSNETEDTS